MLFEESLFGDNPVFEKTDIFDCTFWVNRIVKLPSLRPFLLEQVVGLCQQYCEHAEFRASLLDQAIDQCPVLVYRLYRLGCLSYEEIGELIIKIRNYSAFYYFRKEIPNFLEFMIEKNKPASLKFDFSLDDHQIDLLIEFGFLPSTIEYCLKYDDIDVLTNNFVQYHLEGTQKAKWSPFEWSKEPKSLFLLSFSSYFGSLHCFKFLLTNGFDVNDQVRLNAVCGGNIDIFHLCFHGISDFSQYQVNACRFNRCSLLNFFMDNGSDYNSFISGIIYC